MPYGLLARIQPMRSPEFGTRKRNSLARKVLYMARDYLLRALIALRFGRNLQSMAKEGEAIMCCTDGVRPVSFKPERL